MDGRKMTPPVNVERIPISEYESIGVGRTPIGMMLVVETTFGSHAILFANEKEIRVTMEKLAILVEHMCRENP